MYASLPLSFVKQLVLRSYDYVGNNKHSQDEITLTKRKFVDHETFTYINGDDNLTVRVYYSGRITIAGILDNTAVNQSLF